METVDAYLESEYGVGNLMSPARLVQYANQAKNAGNLNYLHVPESERELKRLVKLMERGSTGGLAPLDYFIDREKGYVRISGQVADAGRKLYDRKNEELMAWLKSDLSTAPFKAKVTGTAHLIDVNNDALSINMIKGLGIAFLVIAVIVGIMYKSLKMVVISLIPNMLPLLMISAIMGFFGIYLKVSTSIIFTIAFGIAVDDTIHFLSKFRIQLAKGRTWQYALKRTYLSTGKAIVVTTLILCAGFLTLVFSDFLGTFYIGLLISLTLAFAVLSDLFLLPVLIIMAHRSKSKQVSTSTSTVQPETKSVAHQS
jgi:predicted RND superfamily exporter protein